jgi:hypothetical protein
MTREHVDRHPPVGLVFGNAHVRLQRRQDHAEVVVLHERSGVPTAVPGRLTAKRIDFSHEIEGEKRTRPRRCVRSTLDRRAAWSITFRRPISPSWCSFTTCVTSKPGGQPPSPSGFQRRDRSWLPSRSAPPRARRARPRRRRRLGRLTLPGELVECLTCARAGLLVLVGRALAKLLAESLIRWRSSEAGGLPPESSAFTQVPDGRRASPPRTGRSR